MRSSSAPLSLGVSIVLYRTPLQAIATLIADLERSGVARIYVIDNTPSAEPEAAGAAELGGRVELIGVGTNLGYGRGHNIAIRRSVGLHRYHLVCNPDIALSEGCIGTLHRYMEEHPEVGLTMPKLLAPDGELQYCCRRSPLLLDYVSQLVLPVWGRRRRRLLEMRDQDYERTMEVPCLSGCFMFFRSSLLEALGGFDERFFLYFEDFDLSLRASARARNVYLPATNVVHERQSAHRRSWRMRFLFARSACQYFAKWGWFRSNIMPGRP